MRERRQVVSTTLVHALILVSWTALGLQLTGCGPRDPEARWSGATLRSVDAPDSTQPDATPTIVTLRGDVRAWVDGGRVEIPAWVALDEGWLEVAVCRRGSRDHESVVVVDAEPSVIHAALLLAGLQPGSPATWDHRLGWRQASGEPVELSIEVVERGRRRVHTLDRVIRDERGDRTPSLVFAGSLMKAPAGAPAAGSRYLADLSGTVVGLSTFGDEVVASREIRSPDASVDPATWTIRPGVLPSAGTMVTAVLARPTSSTDGDDAGYSETSNGS